MGDDTGGRLEFPRPRHPAFWDDDRLLRAPFLRPQQSLLADRDAAVALVRAGNDVTARTVVFDGCVNDGLVSTGDSRAFLSALRPAAGIAAKLAGFRREHLGDGPTIG